MKRQRGRNRGGGGGQGGGGGGKPQHNVNRAFDSNGPDNIKIRGHAQHVYEKYQQLARDASSAGDRVLAENYLQHAEHYFRTLRAIQPNRAASEIVSRDSFTSGYDIDFEDTAAESAMEEADAQAAERAANPQAAPPQAQGGGFQPQGSGQGESEDVQPQQVQNGQGQRREREWKPEAEYRREREERFRERGDRPERIVNNDPRQQAPNGQAGQGGGERPNGEFRDRGDRPRYRDREDRYRDREPRSDAQRQDAPRTDAPRTDGDRPDREFRRDRYDRPDRAAEAPRADPLPVVEPQGGGFGSPASADEGAGVLRSQDGGVSAAPAFLQAAAPTAPVADGDAPARKPRARRKPAAAVETEEV